MSQPELHDQSALDNRDPSEEMAAREAGDRLSQAGNDMDYGTLLRELAQLQELDEERVTRIYHLEQALDQALLCIEELRGQVRDQGILESQLAATEEFSSIQQKAIARLRMQMDQQQQLIEQTLATSVDTNEYHALLQEIMGVMKAIATQQEQETAQYQGCQVTLQTDAEKHALRLEAENNRLQTSLEQRDRQILALEAEALTAHAKTVRLQAEVDTVTQRLRSLQMGVSSEGYVPISIDAQALLNTQDFSTDLTSAGHSPLNSSPGNAPLNMQHELTKMQSQLHELELQLSKQVAAQARWQQRCLELEAESQRYQARASENQQQIAEMQEEILRQTKQAGEYEAAIQHWKDRHLNNQRNLAQLHDLLERVLPHSLIDPSSGVDLSPALSELLAAIQATLLPEQDDELSPTAVPTPHFNTLDLPDFLIRRRNYRKKIHPPSSDPEQ